MILLDTHVLIWRALVPERLSERAKRVVDDASQQGELMIADITLWEIAMLVAKKRIQITTDIDSFLNLLLQAYALRVRPITPRIAATAVQLPDEINRDPADRLIVATALVETIPLVTADRNLQANSLVATLW
jgi:PIN domain nuclease of toxin-antitoxin system